MAIETQPPRFTDILCIGLGLSGVCLGAQLKRKYGFEDIHFYDRNANHSGTWWVNRYPGCACDVPVVFYSFSFELNPNWTRLLPSNDEIHQYLDGVVNKYQLRPRMTFRTECETAKWDSKRQVWSVHLRDLVTGKEFVHECRILFSAIGVLVEPKEADIPGKEIFEGPIFHTARWKDDVDLKNKNVIVIGNGCTASQMVPRITPVTKTLTQFIHTPHWLVEKADVEFGPWARWAFRNIPLLTRFIRLALFLISETEWKMFILNKSGAQVRRATEKACTDYVLRMAPEKYHDTLIPKWEIACKRRVFDTGGVYLKSLHAPNLHLTKDPVLEITPRGIRTANKDYPADVIIMATGFRTNNGLGPLRIQGCDGEWLHDHWKNMGGPGAYNSTAVHGYPNFLMIYGPNSTTGYSSVILAIENMVNYALKIIDPIIKGEASEVEIKQNAEIEYSSRLQAASSGRVWNRCSNWYVTNGWNSTLYPWSQYHFGWRSAFPTWSDWNYKYTTSRPRRIGLRRTWLALLTVGVVGVLALLTDNSFSWPSNLFDFTGEMVGKARAL